MQRVKKAIETQRRSLSTAAGGGDARSTSGRRRAARLVAGRDGGRSLAGLVNQEGRGFAPRVADVHVGTNGGSGESVAR